MKAEARSEFLEYRYYDKYHTNAGFQIAVEGYHNCPTNLPLVCLCSFNPPGDYYKTPQVIDAVFMFSGIKFDSPQGSMRCSEEAKLIKGVNPSENWQIIFDIRSVSFEDGKPTVTELGWSVIPLFDKSRGSEYLNIGIHMVHTIYLLILASCF
jgi:hypothetical protein